ncbi:MAG: tyrosine-type recombinase/integrase, partial [Acidimicrobiia bacterium]|nr:tyrosine-type recombinase/integrase [Acidimicrobiia bacterium]
RIGSTTPDGNPVARITSYPYTHPSSMFGPTKNHQQRAVPLPRTIADQLAEFLTDRASDPDALVFTSPDGSVLRQTNFLRRQYKPAVVEAGLDPALRFHDLRHTAAALMVEMGAHPRAMMERLGHSSVTVTLDTYGHLLPSLEESLTEALDDRLRSAMAVSANKPRPVRAPSDVIPLRKENRSAL